MSTPTPRTDAFVEMYDERFPLTEQTIDFARQLEKELAKAMRELAAANALLREANEALLKTVSFIEAQEYQAGLVSDAAEAGRTARNRIAAHLEENK